LQEAAGKGLKIFLMPGNRDFLLGQEFCQAAGVKLISDPYKIKLDNKQVLLTHGDSLCADDRLYQIYKKLIQHPVTKIIAKNIPVSFLEFIGQKIQQKTRQSKAKKTDYIMDVNQDAVKKVSKDIDILIHGHTHKPAIHHYNSKIRYVLSDWDKKIEILVYANKRFKLMGLDEIGL